MKDWLEEIVDQIALGQFLANTKLSCGQRFGLIAVDNAVEFMLIAYVELDRQLVGGHKVGGIKKADWDNTKSKVPSLLTYVISLESKLQPKESDILRYHGFRNDLYHTGKPLTTSPTHVNKYSVRAREVMGILFGISFSQKEWDDTLARVASALSNNSQVQSIRPEVTFESIDGLVKFATSASLSGIDAVALCLYGYATVTGTEPSRSMLEQSLARSGHALSQAIVNSRLHDLKEKRWLQKNALVLSATGRKQLAKKYLF